MGASKSENKFLRFPVIYYGAEFLVQGYLMRRNILTYHAPPANEGYDLICINPSPRVGGKQIRVQVKSRYQTDCNYSFPVKLKSLNAFDFLIVAYLNVGYFFGKHKKGVSSRLGLKSPEFYTFPREFIEEHLAESSWGEMFRIKREDLESCQKYKDEAGFELIAKTLGIDYPSK